MLEEEMCIERRCWEVYKVSREQNAIKASHLALLFLMIRTPNFINIYNDEIESLQQDNQCDDTIE